MSPSPTTDRRRSTARRSGADLALPSACRWESGVATFCLIHGNWHDGSSWERLIGPLRQRGHDVVAPDLPTDDPATGWAERAEPVLLALDGVQGPIVVVVH